MNDLIKLREEIDELDKNMANLYQQRLKLAKAIAEIKKLKNLPIFDREREEEVIRKNMSLIDDPELKELYREFLELLLDHSKRVQEAI